MTGSIKPTTLDLLSRVLELEFGEPRFQHYGLFPAAAGSDIASTDALLPAQQRFTAQLQMLLARGGSGLNVLVVGDTLFHFAMDFAQKNYSTRWMGSKKLLDTRFNALDTIHYAGSDFVAYSERIAVDVVIHEGSIRYLDQMAILSKSRDLLGDLGQLIVFSEFIADDSRIGYSSLPNHSSFEQLSRRLGFAQLDSLDLSSSAQQTLRIVRPLLEKHGSTLMDEGYADSEVLSQLLAELDSMLSEFDSGRRVFYLKVLRRDLRQTSDWADAQFGDIRSFQPHEIAELFEKSFNVTFNEELWNWKYGLGNGKCVVARLDKQSGIVAHYGGAPRKICYFGKAAMAIQPCDVMVHPGVRKQYGKGSLFFEVAATFLEREIGNTVNHLLGFGFPNQKTMNISKRLGLYEKTDDFIEIVFPAGQSVSSQQQYSVVDYEPDNNASVEELNRLWVAMRADYSDGIIGVRDADYIRYRYVSHPFSKSKQYHCVLIRAVDTRQALAFAVLKQHGAGVLLMDLICPVAFMKQAITILNQSVSADTADSALRVWVTKSGQDKVLTEGAIVNELGIEIPCNSWNPGPSAELLYGAWWLTAGDMDFV
ncbi:MAG: hypothetical protein WDZ52_00035 [Pseudohongiellaceae bacterium]